jgi:multidrug efflux pump subunit AcrB
VTVAIAVLISLLVARLITPMLAAYFLRGQGHPEEGGDGRVMRAYTRLVAWSVRHKFVTLVLGLAFFAGSIQSTALLPSGFLPEEDINRTLFVVELAPGARLEDTVAVTDRVAAKIRELPEVRSAFVSGGQQLPAKKEVRLSTLVVNLTDKSERAKTQKQVENEINLLLKEIPDIRSWVLQENGQRGLSLIVGGSDQREVIETAAKLQQEMSRHPNLVNVVSTAPLDRPEIRIRPKPTVAADLGVSTDVIADTVRVATIGDIGPNLPKFDAGDRQIPIRAQLPETARGDLNLIGSLKVPAKNGAAVPLSTVADIELSQGPTSIERYDRRLRVALEADLYGTDALNDVISQIKALPTAANLPAGVTLSETGDAEVMAEVFQGFAMAMGAGIMMVFGVLVLLFASFVQPVTILLSLPLSVGGAILGLLLAQKAISLPVIIGFLMLMGIVTKNAIMLVDFAIERMAEGVDRVSAIVDAGRKRARPIVMTTIAMAAGMLPSALAVGAGGEFRAPMAIAVIGGLIVSTMLSLVFVPAFFVLMDDLSRLFSWVFGRFVGAADEGGETDEPLAPARLGNRVIPYPTRPTKVAAE